MAAKKTVKPKPSTAMKIKGRVKATEVDVKRFYLPGVKLAGKCPKCDAAYEEDFADNYLGYPKANAPMDHGCYCNECSHEWDVSLVLSIMLTVAEPS